MSKESRCSSTRLRRRNIDDRVYGNQRRSHTSCSRRIGYASRTVGTEIAARTAHQSRKRLSNTADRPWPAHNPFRNRICCAHTSNSAQSIRHRCCSARPTLKSSLHVSNLTNLDFIKILKYL